MSRLIQRRPPPGRRGEQFIATTNSFEVSKLPTQVFYHYNVVIAPEVKPRRRVEIVDMLQTREPNVFTPRASYDGKSNLFSSHKLAIPGNQATFPVTMGNPARQVAGKPRGLFQITVTLVADIKPSSLEAVLQGRAPHNSQSLTAMQLLNVIVRHVPIMNNPHNTRSFFVDHNINTCGSFEIWQGLFQSLRPSPTRMLLNVDLSSAVMYRRGNLLDHVMEFLRINNIRELENIRARGSDFSRLKSHLKGLKVAVMGITRRIQGLEEDGCNYVFDKGAEGEEGVQITVLEYFRQYKQTPVKYPNIPSIRCGKAVVPMELCQILPGQIFKKKIPGEVTTVMIDNSKPRPDKRIELIQKGLKDNSVIDNPFLNQTGMKISAQPERLKGRVLGTPSLYYGRKEVITPRTGAWNVKEALFFKPARIGVWSVVSFNGRGTSLQDIQNFAMMMTDVMRRRGMDVSPQPPCTMAQGQGDIGKQLMSSVKAKPDIIFVILPDSAADIRKGVKQFGDILQGIATQCIRAGKLRRLNDQYCNNVALKVNVKLGGINAISRGEGMNWIGKQPTMVVGADVTHPAPGVCRPSVAGMVSSVDENACNYVAKCSVQGIRDETITDLKDLMINALRMFNQYQHQIAGRQNLWPTSVLFFRDGVSEGEFDKVAEMEIPQIQAAFEEVKQRVPQFKPPKLTFIVVGKRHHTRFFPEKGQAVDKSGNCPAGFVVDTDIINPTLFDFYLQSHAGLLGTSRPSHYIVLQDDNGFDSDSLQAVAYALCFVYARATRSVSIPAPVYYADLICGRADFHFNPNLRFTDDFSSDDGQFNLEKWKKGFSNNKMPQPWNMYFM